MPDIFLSYNREDLAVARRFAEAFEAQSFEVWWDATLKFGEAYDQVTEKALREAKAVVVLWSKRSVESRWVRAEATLAERYKTLVPCTIEACERPIMFELTQTADLSHWQGDAADTAWLAFLRDVGRFVGKDAACAPRPATLPSLPNNSSVVVMPFANLSADPEQEYFVDAVSEEIISALSRWRWIFVIARNSSFSYKGRQVDVRQVAAELGVRYVVSGSVRRVGNRLRISVQLADAADGAQVWGDQFDRQLVDVFALQDEITDHVVRTIWPALLQNENVRLARKPPTNYSALDCFHRGLWHLNKVSRDHYGQAITEFRECIRRDPDLAVGHIGLARILYGGATIYGWSQTPAEDLHEAYDEARTAVALDPEDSDGFLALSGTALYLKHHSEALMAARRAVSLNPNSAYGQFRLAQVLIYAGSPAEAIEPIQHSLVHSPFDPQMGAMLGTLSLACYQLRDYAEAARQARAAIDHEFAPAHVILAASLARLDRLAEARKALPSHVLSRVLGETIRMATYVNDADRDHLIEGLKLAMNSPAP